MERDLTISLQLAPPSPSATWGACALCQEVVDPEAVTSVAVEFPGWPIVRFHVACYATFVSFAADFQRRVVAGPEGGTRGGIA